MIRRYSAQAVWSDEDEGYVATSREFPGISGIDKDPRRALDALQDAIEMAIEVLEEDGRPLPQPQHLSEFSGQFRLRLPVSLHAEIAAAAEREAVSQNAYVVHLISLGLGRSQTDSEIAALRLELHDLIASQVARRLEDPTAFNAPTSWEHDVLFAGAARTGRGD